MSGANQDGPLIWSFHIVELQTSSHNLQCSHLKLESLRTCKLESQASCGDDEQMLLLWGPWNWYNA